MYNFRSGKKILYAWAKNAPKLDLPEGVGFKVGGPTSDIKYLVLQVYRKNTLLKKLFNKSRSLDLLTYVLLFNIMFLL